MSGDRIFERAFVAFGVRIGLRVTGPALFKTPEQDFTRLQLPFGWRAAEDHEADDPVSVLYELRVGSWAGGSPPSYRVYAGTDLIAEVCGLIDVGRALAAHAEFFVAERAPDHLFVHAGVVGWEGLAIVMPGASFAGKTTLVQAWLERVRRTTPMSSRFWTAREECIRSPVRSRSGTARRR